MADAHRAMAKALAKACQTRLNYTVRKSKKTHSAPIHGGGGMVGSMSIEGFPRLLKANAMLSVVIPVYNEGRGLFSLVEHLEATFGSLDLAYEIILVDDGSRDETLAVMHALCAQDRRIRAVSFSRNFGKEIAIAAGLDHAKGDAVVIMDADLQHPPETIIRFVELWRQGFDVVYGVRKQASGYDGLRRFFTDWFYHLFERYSETRLPRGAGDFRLMDRRVVDVLRSMGERARFMKGLYAWVGFRAAGVDFTVAPRAYGVSKFPFTKLLRYGFDGLTSFSTAPLKLATVLGLIISSFALAYALGFLIRTMVWGTEVPGFPSLIVSVMFFSGIQLISLGIIGEYVGRIFEEVKRRPLYVVSEHIGFDADAEPAKSEGELQKPVVERRESLKA
jgi:polyisoprenyl-phosphate glycosyltransferase